MAEVPYATLLRIDTEAARLSRGDRVFVAHWMKLLAIPQTNPVHQRNAQKYADLLLANVEAGRLEPPFNVLPRYTDVPNYVPVWSPPSPVPHMKRKAQQCKTPKTGIELEADRAAILATYNPKLIAVSPTIEANPLDTFAAGSQILASSPRASHDLLASLDKIN